MWIFTIMFYYDFFLASTDDSTKDKAPLPGVLGKVSPMLYFLLHSREQTFYKNNIQSQDYISDTEYIKGTGKGDLCAAATLR